MTVLADRIDRRYIPHVARFPGGLLRLNIGIGPDANFTPCASYHSYDGGKSWMNVENLCPRIEWNDVLGDGSYYEVDDYWFQEFDNPGWYERNLILRRAALPGALEQPSRAGRADGARERRTVIANKKE